MPFEIEITHASIAPPLASYEQPPSAQNLPGICCPAIHTKQMPNERVRMLPAVSVTTSDPASKNVAGSGSRSSGGSSSSSDSRDQLYGPDVDGGATPWIIDSSRSQSICSSQLPSAAENVVWNERSEDAG